MDLVRNARKFIPREIKVYYSTREDFERDGRKYLYESTNNSVICVIHLIAFRLLIFASLGPLRMRVV